MYDLLQAARSWRAYLLPTLVNLAKDSKSDQSMHTLQLERLIIMLIIYVDGIIFTANSSPEVTSFIKALREKLKSPIEPEDTKFVGFSIKRNIGKKKNYKIR